MKFNLFKIYYKINTNYKHNYYGMKYIFVMQGLQVGIVKIILAFGADVNVLDDQNETPLDVLKRVTISSHPDSEDDSEDESPWERFTEFLENVIGKEDTAEKDHLKKKKIVKLLKSVNALTASQLQKHLLTSPSKKRMKPFRDILHHVTTAGSVVPKRVKEIEGEIKEILGKGKQKKKSSNEAMVLMTRMLEVQDYKRAGSRVLVLDGGGIKGLLQLEILRQIEESTGRRITEIFDWIVGTSIGGIITLGLVHGRHCKHATMKTNVTQL